MFEFLLAPENIPFLIALVMMIMIAVMETGGAIFGFGLSELIGQFFSGADLDMDVCDGDFPAPIEWIFSYFRVKGVPVLIILVVALFTFGMSGYLIQDLSFNYYGSLFSKLNGSLIAIVITLPTTRLLSSGLALVIPKDETDAVSRKSFVDSLAEITIGTAKIDSPAEAKVRDAYGHVHYIMLVPNIRNEEFYRGDIVEIVKHDGAIYIAKRPILKEKQT